MTPRQSIGLTGLHTPAGPGPVLSAPSPAPPSDPFADIPDAPRRSFSQGEEDRAADLRAKRDRSAAKGKATKRKQADLESKTRELLRSMGFEYDRAEHTGYTGWKSDLFGFVDGVAVMRLDGPHPGVRLWFVQTTSRDNRAAHVRKMACGTYKVGGNGLDNPCLPAASALALAGLLKLVLWDQPDGPGTRWRHEVQDVSFEELQAVAAKARARGAA